MHELKKEQPIAGLGTPLQERLGPSDIGNPAARLAEWCRTGYWRPAPVPGVVAECVRCDSDPVPGPRRFGVEDPIGYALHAAIHHGWRFGQDAAAFRDRVTAEAAKGRILPD